MKYILTGIIVLIAVTAVLSRYGEYIANPWTRDGQVRAEVVQVTPRVSGPIVKLPIEDNQIVKVGDLLFEIDPRTFEVSLLQAQAEYDNSIDNYNSLEKQVAVVQAQVKVARATVLQANSAIKETDAQIVKNKANYARQQELLPKRATSQKAVDRAKATYIVSVEQRAGGIASLAQAQASLGQEKANLEEAKANLGALGDDNASIRVAKAALDQARLNLEFTQVRAAVDGYITNLNLRIGTQAVANQPAVALVDINSFWIYGYFKETLVGKIHKGDKSIVTLMSYPDTPVKGTVESIAWGISQDDGSTGFELLPEISATFEWIRLAQRIPVRVQLDTLPPEIELRVGATASVLVYTDSSESDKDTPALASPSLLR